MIGDFIKKLNVSTIIYFITNFIRNQEHDRNLAGEIPKAQSKFRIEVNNYTMQFTKLI